MRFHVWFRLSALVPIAAWCLTTVSLAQDPVVPTLHATTSLIVVDAVVLDSHGRPVNNLTKTSFSIEEDKVPQAIYSFDPPSEHRMPEGIVVHGASDLPKVGNVPLTILVLDELNTPWQQIEYAREEMLRFVEGEPETIPQPTLLLAAGDTRFKVLCDYTQSRADLATAIRKHFPEYPWELMRSDSDQGENAVERMVKTLGVLEQIADSTRGTGGRKNVVWVGGGYPDIDPSSLIGKGVDRLSATVREVTSRMLAAHLTLSTVDPAGVSSGINLLPLDAATESTSPASNLKQLGPFTGELDFGNLASSTGGAAYFGRNEIGRQVASAVEAGANYYTLSYRPSQSSIDSQKYRRIRVRVSDPTLRVVSRDGYFGNATSHIDPPPTPRGKPAQQLDFDISSAARSRLAYTGIEMAAAKAKEGPGFIVRFRANNVEFRAQEDGTRKAELTVLEVFFDAKDKELAHKATELKLGLTDEKAADKKAVGGFDLPTEAPAGAVRARFVLRDAATGLLGTAEVSLVPAVAK